MLLVIGGELIGLESGRSRVPSDSAVDVCFCARAAGFPTREQGMKMVLHTSLNVLSRGKEFAGICWNKVKRTKPPMAQVKAYLWDLYRMIRSERVNIILEKKTMINKDITSGERVSQKEHRL